MSPGASLDPRVERSRRRVLDATTTLVIERGIAGATIEAVSARSGVAKTTIYRQWPHQAALVLDAFRTLLDDQPTPDTGSLRGDLVELVAGLATALGESTAARLMPALMDAAERDPDFAALHAREAERRHAPVLAVLARGQARGELPSDADLGELVDRLAGPVFHRRYVSGGQPDRAFAERIVDTVLAAP